MTCDREARLTVGSIPADDSGREILFCKKKKKKDGNKLVERDNPDYL